ncbi:hypothetical protein TWF694_000209 [Orbilia ellipsospora]|uniref:Uncharacterized protein n=1 Tax=Orbilia ellipsospora TaxID=2528407 RepID=A0AAV9XNA8_9PEZI
MPSNSKIDLKSARVKRIRTAAAKVLSEVFEREVPASDVTFITPHNKGYHWYLSRRTVEIESGEIIEEEFDLPEWTTNQIHRWKIDESSEMLEWLRKGELQAEILGIERRRLDKPTVCGQPVEELAPKRCFIQEVRVIELTEKEKLAEKLKWKQPSQTIKGPASEFVAWMTGAADREASFKMVKKYFLPRGVEDEGKERTTELSVHGSNSISRDIEFSSCELDDEEYLPLIYAR